MHTRTTTAAGLLLAAGLALTACSSSSDDTAPTSTTPATVAAKPTTAPATEPPVPDSALATGARTAACWKAIRDQYGPGTVQLTGAPTTPPECAGLTSDEISAVAEDVLEHQLG